MVVLNTDTVRDYLPAYGYTPKDEDKIMITHALERAIERALAFTNQKKLPEGLKYEVIQMAVGEFLFLKKSIGGFNDSDEGIVFPDLIKQFTEGDTNVSANSHGANNEKNFETMVNNMRFGDPIVLEHYRRLHW